MTTTTTPPRRRELLPDVVRRLAASPAYDKIVRDERTAAFEKRKAIAAKLAAELPTLNKALAAAEKAEHDAAAAAEKANIAARVASAAYTDARQAKTGREYVRDTRIADAHRALQALADPRIGALYRHVQAVRNQIPAAFRSVPIARPNPGEPRAATNTAACDAAMSGTRAMLDELDALAIDATLDPDALRQRLVAMLDRLAALLAPLGETQFPKHEIEE